MFVLLTQNMMTITVDGKDKQNKKIFERKIQIYIDRKKPPRYCYTDVTQLIYTVKIFEKKQNLYRNGYFDLFLQFIQLCSRMLLQVVDIIELGKVFLQPKPYIISVRKF